MNNSIEDLQHGHMHIVYLGEAGFPKGLGAVQRMTLVAKSLLHANAKVTVLCRKGTIRDLKYKLSPEGNFEGIDYIYITGNVYRPMGFFKRNMLKIKGIIGEFSYLNKQKKEDNIKTAIVSSHSVIHVFRYYLYSRIIGFPIVLNFVELASSMKGREKLLTRINDHIFDRFIIKLVDGALPISNKLVEYYKEYAPTKPFLKLPILCDFKKFNLESEIKEECVFLYCGAASYFELIDFVLQAFDELDNLSDKVILKLVLGGKDAELKKVEERIEKANHRRGVKLITNVNHKDIPKHFVNASALLIPLRPSLQDEARFPHKIGEYLAAGRPMITTRFGEIKHYDFIDGETALIAEEYEVKAYATKMDYILKYPEKAREIGKKGRQMGLENFEYSRHGQILLNFLRLVSRR